MISGMNNKIAIIGPYPPPYGGISVHIERILNYLPDHAYDFYNIQKKSNRGKKFYGIWKYIYFIDFFFTQYKVIHYHSTSKKVRLLLSIISLFRSNVYLHLHGESYTDTISRKGITSWFLKRLIPNTHFIVSNDKLFSIIQELKPRSLHNFDAFIPPKFDQNIIDIFNKSYIFPNTQYKICMVGWFARYKNNDLYGFDLALKALQLLRNKYTIDISIVASVNGINDNKLYSQFLEVRKEYNLDSTFILIGENLKEVYPLYLSSHIFIRPTNADGNSVSVKEALWFGSPVVASDCIIRPDEVVLKIAMLMIWLKRLCF
ncbi:hypothetical protein ES705_25048 [subsurface metagenome]